MGRKPFSMPLADKRNRPVSSVARPVDIYIAQTVCRTDTDDVRRKTSFDQKMRRLLRDKGQTSSLALDGSLPERSETTIELQQLLESLTKDWRQPTSVLHENDLQRKIIEVGR